MNDSNAECANKQVLFRNYFDISRAVKLLNKIRFKEPEKLYNFQNAGGGNAQSSRKRGHAATSVAQLTACSLGMLVRRPPGTV
jgi:hypothetical protein